MSFDEIERILIECSSSTEAIASLYQVAKERSNKFSYAIICRLSGIASPGFVSEIIHGRRILPEKYATGICRAFGLRDLNAEILKLLIQCDNLNKGKMREEFERRLATLRKVSSFRRKTIPSGGGLNSFLLMTVLAAFGLFSLRATSKEIKSCFCEEDEPLIDAVLTRLVTDQIIKLDGEHYVLLDKNLFFFGDEDKYPQLDFMRQVLEEATVQVVKPPVEGQPEVFESFVLSVKASECQGALTRVRQQIRELATSLGNEEGDMVVRLNLQLYPILKKPVNQPTHG